MAPEKIKEVQVSKLIEDFDLYPRNDVSSPTITSIVDAIESGISMPPIIVEKKTMRIVDGFHRKRAYERLKYETIPAYVRTYIEEEDFFIDAIQANRNHGRSFDPYDRKRCIARLNEWDMSLKKMGEVMHMPPARVENTIKGFGTSSDGKSVPMKSGMAIPAKRLTKAQVRAVEKYGGMHGTYHARQVVTLLEVGMEIPTQAFVEEMDRLSELWSECRDRVLGRVLEKEIAG